MSKYLVTWVEKFWETKRGLIELVEEQRKTQIIDNFEPTQESIKKFEESRRIDDKEHGLYWTATLLSFSKLEEDRNG